MPYYIAKGGSNLYRVTTGGTATALTLPTGVSEISGRRPRFTVLGRAVIVTNAFSVSLLVDPDFNVYPMQLRPPVSAPTLTSAVAGSLSGNFRVKYTHIIKDPLSGRIIAESDFSPISAESGTITSKRLKAVVEVSQDPGVTHRRLYRTTTGPGTTYFPWIDLEGNTLTAVSDDMSDALLQLVASPTGLGSAPGMVPGTFMPVVTEWKDRLWGVGGDENDVDILRYTEIEQPYAWKTSNDFNIPPVGFDQFGITGLLPRRDELGVLKRNFFVKIIGDGTRFERVKVHTGKGCYATESCLVIDDVGYFLGEDGVYTWGGQNLACISDGAVRQWFTTDTYFNRAQYPNAFAKYNAKYHGYELHLAAAGSSNIDRWVFYDIARGKWWGPHKTDAFTPTSAQGFFLDSNSIFVPVTGASNGKIYKGNQTGFSDATTDDIAISAQTGRMSADTPNIKKLFLGPSFIFKSQAAAGNLQVECYIGDLEATTTFNGVLRTLSIDQTNDNRQDFSPLGTGEYCSFLFTETTNSQGCQLFGFELPSHELGQR